MADKHFFDLFKDKMAALKPKEEHKAEDWTILGSRLNEALPKAPHKQRRGIVLPLLLLTALLSSNALWWQNTRDDKATLAQLQQQMSGIQTQLASWRQHPIMNKSVIVHDTIWQTVYSQVKEPIVQHQSTSDQNVLTDPGGTQEQTFKSSGISAPQPEQNIVAVPAGSSDSKIGGHETLSQEDHQTAPSFARKRITTDLSTLELRQFVALESPKRSYTLHRIQATPASEKPESFTVKPSKADIFFRPKFVKAGVNVGWLHAASQALMHEGGSSFNMNGEIGFSRHWSITATYTTGRMHYKAHNAEAILGAPAFPALATGHHLAEIDVTGQRIRQWELGIRYTMPIVGKPHPYFGLGWTYQTLLPFSVQYETEHEMTGAIHKDVFAISTKTRQPNILYFSAGLGIPIMSGLSLNMEGFYQRAWKKQYNMSPDLTGIRAGLNWCF